VIDVITRTGRVLIEEEFEGERVRNGAFPKPLVVPTGIYVRDWKTKCNYKISKAVKDWFKLELLGRKGVVIPSETFHRAPMKIAAKTKYTFQK
jgi:late competence protein required for DNA uptake (superfamily II DNA/RNA helicase)